MQNLSLKANHKPIREYYDALEIYRRLGQDFDLEGNICKNPKLSGKTHLILLLGKNSCLLH
jgi:hypothetical protein